MSILHVGCNKNSAHITRCVGFKYPLELNFRIINVFCLPYYKIKKRKTKFALSNGAFKIKRLKFSSALMSNSALNIVDAQ